MSIFYRLGFYGLLVGLTACIALPEPDANVLPTTVSDLPTDTQNGEATIITFGLQAVEQAAYKPIADRFMVENPDIRIQFVPLDPLYNTDMRIDPLIEQTVRLVDTAAANFISPTSVQWHAQMGTVQSLSPFIQGDAAFDHEDFYPGMLETVTFDDQIYMLPRDNIVGLLTYNKDLWDKAGLPTPDPTWRWPDIRAAATQLSNQTSTDGAAPYGFIDSFATTTLLFELHEAGINPHHILPDTIPLDDPVFINALTEIQELTQTRAVYLPPSPTLGLVDFEPIQEQISTQQIGIWDYNLTPEDLPFEVGVLPHPLNNRDSVVGYIMSAGTLHPEKAWRWLSFLSANEPPSRYDEMVNVPARQSFAARSGYWDQIGPEESSVLRAALELPITPPINTDLSDSPAMVPDSLFSGHMDLLIDTVRDVVDTGRTPTQAARAAQTELAQRLADRAATPVATLEPIVVATPVPQVAQPTATSITFTTVGLNRATVQMLAYQFSQRYPDLVVEVNDTLENSSNVNVTSVAATSDCFSWFQPPSVMEQSALLDLRPLWDADTSLSRDVFPAAVTAPFEQDGALYGLPHRMDIPTLHYNPILFDAANLPPPTADWSVDDFVAAATQLTQEREDQYGFAVVGNHTSALEWWLQREGGLEAANDLTWTDPDVLADLQGYVDLLTSTSPHDQLAGYSRTADPDLTAQLIAEGQVAMWLESSVTFGEADATVAEAAVAPLPGGTRDNRTDDVAVTTSLHIAADTPHADACWQWLRFLSADATSLDGGFPARTDVAIPTADDQSFGHAEVYAVYQEALAQTTQREEQPFFLRDPDLDPFWFYQALDQALQGANLEQELTNAQQLTEAYLACVDAGGGGSDCAVEVDPDYD